MNKITLLGMSSSKSEEWWTPLDFYKKLDEQFHFTLDPCAEPSNRLRCSVFFTKADDGLSKKEWPIGNVFCNPPYGRGVGKWVKKCSEHAAAGKGTVVLLTAGRIDAAWFHNLIWDKPNVEFIPIQGRVKFYNPVKEEEDRKAGKRYTKNNNSPFFPSILAIFRPPPSSPENLGSMRNVYRDQCNLLDT